MQLDETAKAEERRSQMSEEKQMKMNDEKRTINIWMSKYKLPKEMKEKIIQYVEQNLERNRDVNVQNLWSHIPRDTSRAVKCHLCMDLLKTVSLCFKWAK